MQARFHEGAFDGILLAATLAESSEGRLSLAPNNFSSATLAVGVRHIAAGGSAVNLMRELNLGLQPVPDCIQARSRAATGKREKAQVATISAHNNSGVGGPLLEEPGKRQRECRSGAWRSLIPHA